MFAGDEGASRRAPPRLTLATAAASARTPEGGLRLNVRNPPPGGWRLELAGGQPGQGYRLLVASAVVPEFYGPQEQREYIMA